MQQINVNELKPHPRNNEFFDDMSGEKWDEFLQSVESRGVIEPIVITPDKVIVSGHQRVRACKELGITTVMCDVHTYNNDDQILQDLLETNIRQRGDVGGSAKKVGLRIKELERLYGVKQGSSGFYGNRFVESTNKSETLKTQEEIADSMNMSVDTLRNYKTLTDMIPELEELVDTGTVTKTTALSLMKQLSPQEQEELISSMDTTKKLTQKEVQKYIDEINELKSQLKNTDETKEKFEQNTETKIDKPETLEKIKALEDELASEKAKNVQSANEIIENNKKLSHFMSSSTNYQLVSHCSEITLKMLNFVKDMSQYDYMAESFNEIPDATRIEYEKCIKSVQKWAERILNVINNEKNIIDM